VNRPEVQDGSFIGGFSAMTVSLAELPLTALQARFVALLPKIDTHGRIYFRHVHCPHRKADALQEMRALAWLWFVQLARRNKDAADFFSTFSGFLARAVNSGRRLSGMPKAKDVFGFRPQQNHGYAVFSLSDDRCLPGDLLAQALLDNRQTPPPDQAAFRLDFPAWLSTRTVRDRRVINDLMRGERTLQVSRRYGLSPGRVSQLRREFHADWDHFCADTQADPAIIA
jgi:hypothetical protein